MRYFFKFFLILSLTWFSSCQNESVKPNPKAIASPAYFNLSQFISGQVKQLQSAPIAVEKTFVTPPDAPEIKVLRTINWEHELETFTQADINKPALRAAYAITTTPEANGRIKTIYRKRPGYRDAPVEYLEVTTSADKQVVAIKGRHRDDNYLVKSTKDFSLQCEPVNGQNQIISYQISGTQKTVFLRPLEYRIKGIIQ
ncbi:hypothetical protein [Adhaeribacter pallidiroseus]|uniref:Uncharacterized protein n=1 Tax=Adhaeribacter pallidiroseus TaxID=2072847 RepID=A0A369QN28_9BACT|nr:hypothetical protein [Adhaeribacter pallidiroseus]RDC65770.1 hypothetical protein AHMF7616_04400 [Adhaeribacter pallidiroseus]